MFPKHLMWVRFPPGPLLQFWHTCCISTITTKPKHMRRSLLFLLVICLLQINNAFAAHFKGYDMAFINIKDAQGNPTDNYKLRLNFYHSAFSIPISTSFSFSIIENNTNTAIGNPIIVTKINPQTFLTYSPDDCLPSSIQSNIEYGLYESPPINMSTYNSTSGYYIATSSCCMNSANNIVSTYSFLMTLDIPRLGTTSPYRYNSSPVFNKLAVTKFCVGKPAQFNLNVTDSDSDSLVFSVSGIIDGSNYKPYVFVPFSQGYGLDTNIIDGSPDLTIHPNTGQVSFTPTRNSEYCISFKCEEYRNGVKIGEVRREYIIETIICNELPPIIVDKNKRVSVSDTIYVSDTITYRNFFKAKEQLGDSIFIKFESESGFYNDITNSNLFNVKWSDQTGLIATGSAIKNILFKSKDSILTSFIWEIDTTDIKEEPYKFKIISFDKTCPMPLADTIEVELSIKGQCYNSSVRQIIGCDSVIRINGEVLYKDTFLIDTIQAKIGCDTIMSSIIKINRSSYSIIKSVACDSVLGVDNKYYFSDTIIHYTIINQNNCDSNIIQDIKIDNTPIEFNIYGLSEIIDTSLSYYYMIDSLPGINIDWQITNGIILSGANSAKVEVKWSVVGNGQLTCTTYLDTLCKRKEILNTNILVGLNNSKSSEISFYPNPSQEIIYINGLNKNELNTIEIKDVQRRLLISTILLENGIINISTLNKGFYILIINRKTFKFIKI